MIQQFTGVAHLPKPDRWIIHGKREIYDSPWVSLNLVDVEPTGGNRYEHHVVGIPYEAVCTIVHHLTNGVLLLYRHRFITDTAGFEIPAGGVAEGESVVDAASREVLEETGWIVSTPRVFLQANASDGVSNQRFTFLYAVAERENGIPVDKYEAQCLYWVPPAELPFLIRNGYVPGCPAMTGLLYALQFGFFDTTARP